MRRGRTGAACVVHHRRPVLVERVRGAQCARETPCDLEPHGRVVRHVCLGIEVRCICMDEGGAVRVVAVVVVVVVVVMVVVVVRVVVVIVVIVGSVG